MSDHPSSSVASKKNTRRKRRACQALPATWTRSTWTARPPVVREAEALITKPRSLATTMLSWLPPDAVLMSKDAKNLLNAFGLVKAELQRRTNLMSKSSVETGATRDVLLHGIAVPPEVFSQVLEYLPRHEAVHTSSRVCKAWLTVSRVPHFWRALNNDSGLLEKSTTVSNMTSLLKLLQHPQFASLKSLTPPDTVQMRKHAFDQIAKACPMLQEIDVGYSTWSHMKPDDDALVSLTSIFPRLTKVRLGQYKITDSGIASFCERMGDRLVSIAIADCFLCHKKLSDATLELIGRSCPNLESFVYELSDYNRKKDWFRYSLTKKGINALLQGCKKLKSLVLIDVDNILLGDLQNAISEANLDELRVLAVWEGDYAHVVAPYVANDDSFVVICLDNHHGHIEALRRNNQTHPYWC